MFAYILLKYRDTSDFISGRNSLDSVKWHERKDSLRDAGKARLNLLRVKMECFAIAIE